jgi:hypothetical protein
MRALVVMAVGLSLLASVAPDVCAEPQKKRHARVHAPSSTSYVTPKPGYRTNSWYEHEANKLPMGTETWWDQMVREDRARR